MNNSLYRYITVPLVLKYTVSIYMYNSYNFMKYNDMLANTTDQQGDKDLTSPLRNVDERREQEGHQAVRIVNKRKPSLEETRRMMSVFQLVPTIAKANRRCHPTVCRCVSLRNPYFRNLK